MEFQIKQNSPNGDTTFQSDVKKKKLVGIFNAPKSVDRR
jgi:hypothetical protein